MDRGIQRASRRARSAVVMTGIPAAALEQVRENVACAGELQVPELDKADDGACDRLAAHESSGGGERGGVISADGAQAATAVVVQSGSTATSIVAGFHRCCEVCSGAMVAVDVDYTGQTGYVGTPVAGAYLRQALTDVDYIRRVTFNVARVSQVSGTALTLAEALPGGAPAAGAKVQALTGFVDREGGSFCQEWSALFAIQGSHGERVFFHYPRLQSTGGAEEETHALDGKNKNGLGRVMLQGKFLALPVTDVLDGERVVCYRSFLPAANALI